MPGIEKTLKEWKAGDLHSGSKNGPKVKSHAQAVAIGLSEERKMDHAKQPKGHGMSKMEHKSSDIPFGHITSGQPNEHHIEQGHKVHGAERKNDGAGRHGHDESGHSSYSEHKEPRHAAGSHTVQGYIPAGEGVAGHPGEVMRMDHEHQLVGGNYKQSDHEPAVLKAVHGPAGGIGTHTGMGTKPSGYGHQAHQREGVLRNSGHPKAHRIGKR